MVYGHSQWNMLLLCRSRAKGQSKTKLNSKENILRSQTFSFPFILWLFMLLIQKNMFKDKSHQSNLEKKE